MPGTTGRGKTNQHARTQVHNLPGATGPNDNKSPNPHAGPRPARCDEHKKKRLNASGRKTTTCWAQLGPGKTNQRKRKRDPDLLGGNWPWRNKSAQPGTRHNLLDNWAKANASTRRATRPRPAGGIWAQENKSTQPDARPRLGPGENTAGNRTTNCWTQLAPKKINTDGK